MCSLRGRAHKQEDPKRTGQKFIMLNFVQPKNCNTKDLKEAKEKTRDANTSRSVPKKRYSRNHFDKCSFIGVGRFSMPFMFALLESGRGEVGSHLAKISVKAFHIHILIDKRLKDMHTPPWDIKQEREHEAANPGPSIAEALKEGRQDDWSDPSEMKIRLPGGDRDQMEKSHDVTVLGDVALDMDMAAEVGPEIQKWQVLSSKKFRTLARSRERVSTWIYGAMTRKISLSSRLSTSPLQ